MKTRIAIIMVFMLVVSQVLPVSATESNIVSNINVTPNQIYVYGNTGKALDEVSIMVINPGSTFNSIQAVTNSYEFFQKVAYSTIVSTNYDGYYEFNIGMDDTEGATVYITNGKESYIAKIVNGIVVENIDCYVSCVDYRNGKILIKGKSEYANTEFKLVVLNDGFSFQDYQNNIDGALLQEKKIVTSDDARFEIYLDDFTEDSKEYAAYVVKDGNDFELYNGNTFVLKKPVEIYVSESRTGDNVFSSVTLARDYLRNNLKDVPVNVIIDEGKYHVTKTIEFTQEDKRDVSTRVKYIGAGTETIFSGAIKLDTSNFTTVTDTEILNKAADNVKGKLLEINLETEGISEEIINFSKNYDNPSNIGKFVKIPNMYLNSDPQIISKWPNEGFVKFDQVLNVGATQEQVSNGTALPTDGGVAVLSNIEKLNSWKNAEDLYLKGYFSSTWNGEWVKVGSVEPEEQTITMKYATRNGLKSGRFIAVNLLEEIDSIGEWYIDSSTKKLYYLPPYELTEEDIFEISTLNDSIISINGADCVNFENITFEKGRNDGINIKNSKGVCIYHSTVRYVQGNGVNFADELSKDVWIDSSRIHDVGLTGVLVRGNNVNTLISSNNIVSNCNISDVSLQSMNNSEEAIQVSATGALVEKNTIHKTRSNALRYSGSENIIRNNEIYLAATETADSGAIYTGRTWTSVGNIIEKNYIHKTGTKEDIGMDIWYLYFDDNSAGSIARGNILVGMDREYVKGVQVAQGPNNVINSNTFVNFGEGSIVDFSYRNGIAQSILDEFSTLPYTETVYKSKYPYLTELGKLYNTETKVFDYKNYRENTQVNNNIKFNSGIMLDDDGASNWWVSNGYRDKETLMYTSAGDNREIQESIFVDIDDGDFRTNDSYDAPEGVLTELNFDLNTIGVQTQIPKAREFELVHPRDGKIISESEVELKWQKSPDADKYLYYISNDDKFENIIKSGETEGTSIFVDGLDTNATYYWKVIAKTEARICESFECEKAYSFFTIGEEEENESIVYGEIVVADTQGNVNPTLENGQKITITDEVTSDMFTFEKLVYIFAVYSNSGELVYSRIKPVTVVADENPVLVMEFTVPEIKNADNYKVFRWKSLETLRPRY